MSDSARAQGLVSFGVWLGMARMEGVMYGRNKALERCDEAYERYLTGQRAELWTPQETDAMLHVLADTRARINGFADRPNLTP